VAWVIKRKVAVIIGHVYEDLRQIDEKFRQSGFTALGIL